MVLDFLNLMELGFVAKSMKSIYWVMDKIMVTYKDLIKFNFTDLRNNKTIIFRAFLTNIQDSISPEWNNYRYIGRPDDVYVYKGTSRSVSFSLKGSSIFKKGNDTNVGKE